MSASASRSGVVGNALGGFTAMLVALPSAIAFGLVVYSPLGPAHAAEGALSGVLGAITIGLVAPIFGGAPRLVSAPCAPAAAVLGGLVTALVGRGLSPTLVPLILTLTVIFSGLLQTLFGALRGGQLIKYIPYPVIAGYLGGVGLLIILGQLPKLFGLAKDVGTLQGLADPSLWQWPAVAVGLTSAGVMLAAPYAIRILPPPILALAAGVGIYCAIVPMKPEMATLAGNALVIGPLGGPLDAAGGSGLLSSFLAALRERWSHLGELRAEDVRLFLMPTLTLAVLLSIDTLKTCVVLDALTRTRHLSSRELFAQGLGNVTSGLACGMAGAGTMGATLVNLNSGGRTRLSGFLAGAFAGLAFLFLGRFVAWVPVSALAGILVVVGFRMIDFKSIRLLGRRSTSLDFTVIAAVIFTAVALNLMAASAVGTGLAILLFLRDQIRESVVRRKAFGSQVFSKKRRLPAEFAALEASGETAVIFELQGSLFFGTTDQLLTELEPHLARSRYVVLDLRRVRSVDFTATHLLKQIEARVADAGGTLVFCSLPRGLPTGHDLLTYFGEVGLAGSLRRIKIFPGLSDALEWTENQILEARKIAHPGDRAPLTLAEMQVLEGLPPQALTALQACVVELSFEAGQKIFAEGASGDELYFVRKGSVRIELPLAKDQCHHVATVSRGDFFGELSFLDGGLRSAAAVATGTVHLYGLSRARFDRACEGDPSLSAILGRLARILAIRLRQTDLELRVMAET